VQREEAQFIDVREVCEFDAARVEHFRLFPMSQASTWLGGIDQQLDPDKKTYVLCHHGVRSMHACQLLRKQGFSNLFNVSGGIAQYSMEVDPSVPQY
jgi:rhodanese-related sulfurtransferase